MKRKFVAIIMAAVLMEGCKAKVDFNDETLIDTLSDDKYQISTYPVDSDNNESLEGQWILVSKDLSLSLTQVEQSSGNTNVNEFNGVLRCVCHIYKITETLYSNSCFTYDDELNLSDNSLTSNSGAVALTVTDNTHLFGTVSYANTSTSAGYEETVEGEYSVRMVKVGGLQNSLGSMDLVTENSQKTVTVTEFIEAETLHTFQFNDNEPKTDTQHSFAMYDDNTTKLDMNFTSKDNYAGLLDGTTEWRDGAASGELSVSDGHQVIFSVSAEDDEQGLFLADIHLQF